MIEQTIQRWHAFVKSNDPSGLDALLADNVTFHSPVVHTPQAGRELTRMYLMGAAAVFANSDFRYVREVMSGNDAVLEFVTEIDGITINGIDMIQCNDAGLITDFKVMLRPLKAVNMVHRQMAAMLESFQKGAAPAS